MLNNNQIDRDVATVELKKLFATVPEVTINKAIDTCIEKVTKFTEDEKKNGSSKSEEQEKDGQKCGYTATIFTMCVHREIFINCPSEIWTDCKYIDILNK